MLTFPSLTHEKILIARTFSMCVRVLWFVNLLRHGGMMLGEGITGPENAVRTVAVGSAL